MHLKMLDSDHQACTLRRILLYNLHTSTMEISQAITRTKEIANEAAQLIRTQLDSTIKIYWFGSWPKGEARPGSDIDLAVSSSTPIPLDTMASLRDKLNDLPTLYHIDIVDLDAVGPFLKQEILTHGIRL